MCHVSCAMCHVRGTATRHRMLLLDTSQRTPRHKTSRLTGARSVWEVPPGAPAAKLLRDFDPEVNALYRFVALRDVTKRLAKPCVMDIKMGRRQYGYGASARGASP